MVHLYYGDGKGKTSAAAGMCIRALGRGIPVIFAQFLKDASSGEIRFLEKTAGVKVMHTPHFFGFYKSMSEEEKDKTVSECRELLENVRKMAEDQKKTEENADISLLIVLDEILTAMDRGIFSEDELVDLLRDMPDDMEVVLTGKTAPERLLKEADYASEIKKAAHPYEKGVKARYGIEK